MKEAASDGSGVEVATTAGYLAVERAQLADSELEGIHRHPYEEIFVVLEGQARFTLGSDIHASARFVTEWLEDEVDGPS